MDEYRFPIQVLASAVVFLLMALAGCSSTGVVQVDKDTYMIGKRSAQAGFGPPIGVTGDVYSEANQYCAEQKRVVETVKLDQTNSGFAKPGAVSLTFRCIAKQ